ncbi:MAG TPA: helix-turn-helix domain-containing protein [Sphingomonas sp.]|uniref:helix-turn-helix domain-containing protein n=1 Tax=Sphingomonas sp. TaxID=28214 RepID=UPI002ED803EA
MSIRLMTTVWDLDLPPGEKLVLLALADQANDEGRQCWPAVSTIMKRSGQGERTVRRALHDLEAKGHLTRHHRDGGSTQYHLHPGQIGTPAKSAPLPNATATPAKSAPKPSGTTTSEKDKPSRKKRAAKPPAFALPADIPSEPWADFEDMRRRIGKPMTPKARDLAVTRLRKLADDGFPPGDVLNHSTLNNYQGLFPPKDDQNGQRRNDAVAGHDRQRGSASGMGPTVDAAQRFLARREAAPEG